MAFKLTTLRWDGTCAACDSPVPAADRAWWDQLGVKVVCTRCRPVEFEPATLALVEMRSEVEVPALAGVGAGSRAGAETGFAASESFDASSFGPADEPPSEPTSWGAAVAAHDRLHRFLDQALTGRAVVLHDRAIRTHSERVEVDHLIVAASGVWIIDVHTAADVMELRGGAGVRMSDSGLSIGRRHHTSIVETANRATSAVNDLLEPLHLGAIPVHRALCLTDSEWSATPNATVIDGILVLSPDKLCSVARQPGSVGPDEINAIATQLSAGLPAVR